ncbi:MAG: DNA ligase D [Proteobacteria bacterium]|nr:DNA ligase D [Pseudomonadota bacterium]
MAASRDTLLRYRQKRDFKKTPEPNGIAKKTGGHRYLIQKHAATRLHYDFRLELDGVLKSWAVTRGPSLDPHEKRLAVEVEDHPVSYGSFEGTIPKGQYGGGTVMLWDEGEWEPIGDPHKGLARGKLEFTLHGKRLSGQWTLVRMKDREKDRGRHNWLLIKRTDNAAHIGDSDALLTKNTTSVASGRSMEKIARGDSVWQSGKAQKTAPKSLKKAAAPAAKAVKLPAFRPPQLATLTDTVPGGENWVHEIKFDGYRGLAFIQQGRARILTRTGQDWTHKFGRIARALESLNIESAILDGEIVALDEKGHSNFKALQLALSEGRDDLQYYAFDLLHLNGEDMEKRPLLERKARLEKLLRAKSLNGRVLYSEHVAHGQGALLQRMCALELEGIISKRADAPYRHGRGTVWLKTKCHKRQEFVIGGFTQPTHAERGIGALLIGYYQNGTFTYAGKVGTGFDTATSVGLRKKLDKLAAKTMSFGAVPADGRRGAQWVKPALVCEVEFSEWTPEGRLRHPSFQGLREDKPAQAIGRDVAKAATKTPAKPVAKTKLAAGKASVGGIAISHPERVIYPDIGVTKLQLAEYYAAIARHLLPHVKNRPLSMLRCPEGTGDACFFQRHIAQGQSPHLYDTGIQVKGRREEYVMIKDAGGLVTLAQWGVIELHPWGCLSDKPDMPDRLIFDLDPDAAVPRPQVIEAAQEVRMRMQEFGLQSFIKTTGGKGLHVVVPLQRAYGWPPLKAFARAVAESMQHDNPKRYIAKASKEARKGRIFVDYLRNDLTATAIAAFSARAREGAPVAMPLDWKDTAAMQNPLRFTIETVPGILARRKQDPWEEFFCLRQKLAVAHLRALGIDA